MHHFRSRCSYTWTRWSLRTTLTIPKIKTYLKALRIYNLACPRKSANTVSILVNWAFSFFKSASFTRSQNSFVSIFSFTATHYTVPARLSTAKIRHELKPLNALCHKAKSTHGNDIYIKSSNVRVPPETQILGKIQILSLSYLWPHEAVARVDETSALFRLL